MFLIEFPEYAGISIHELTQLQEENRFWLDAANTDAKRLMKDHFPGKIST